MSYTPDLDKLSEHILELRAYVMINEGICPHNLYLGHEEYTLIRKWGCYHMDFHVLRHQGTVWGMSVHLVDEPSYVNVR